MAAVHAAVRVPDVKSMGKFIRKLNVTVLFGLLKVKRMRLIMGLLDQLWDDTVAGPRPDSGLGKLRKYASFSPSSSSSTMSPSPISAAAAAADAPAVTRSITILRPPALSVTSPRGSESGPSTPSSPASVPDSPFGSAPTPKGSEGWKKLRRGAARMADGVDGGAGGQPRSPTVYDWVVISSLDR
uniref:Uncharacterized protein n=2 Tax=Oryza meridionalis TaxID=40149 RepID=A0A0E0ESJ9_9ORYZ